MGTNLDKTLQISIHSLTLFLEHRAKTIAFHIAKNEKEEKKRERNEP